MGWWIKGQKKKLTVCLIFVKYLFPYKNKDIIKLKKMKKEAIELQVSRFRE